MKPALLFTALLGLAVPMAQAAPDGYLLFDHSTSTLIDPATARGVLQDTLLAMRRVYGGRWWPLLLRALLISTLYAITLGLVFVVAWMVLIVF